MLKSALFSDFLLAGTNLCYLVQCNYELNANTKTWESSATGLKDFLTEFGFDTALDLGKDLWGTLEAITLALNTCRYDAAQEFADRLKPERIVPRLTAISTAIYSESRKRQLAEVRPGDVSQKLRNLPTTLTLTDPQKHLLDETIRCIECEAYRSAAVMSWNLAYDYVRQWIFDDATRLAAFNSELVKNPKYSAIVNYEDFYEQKEPPGEFAVLEACKKASIIGGKPFNKLIHYLRERNQYAHPNDTMPTMHTTNAYIENLINLITIAPFR